MTSRASFAIEKSLGPSGSGGFSLSRWPRFRVPGRKLEPDLCLVCSSLNTPPRCQLLNQTETVAGTESFVGIESRSMVVDRDSEAFLLEIDP
jgi:hypothetical protein